MICFKTSRGSLYPVCLVIRLEVPRVFSPRASKMAEAFAREITLTTLEPLFSRVFAHVYIQRTSLSARMIALIAFAGLLSSVSALVFFHMRSSSA